MAKWYMLVKDLSKTGSSKHIDTSEDYYRLLDNGTRVHFDGENFDPAHAFAKLVGSDMVRHAIYLVDKNEERLQDKAYPQDGSRLRIQVRKSSGPFIIPAHKYVLAEEKKKAQSSNAAERKSKQTAEGIQNEKVLKRHETQKTDQDKTPRAKVTQTLLTATFSSQTPTSTKSSQSKLNCESSECKRKEKELEAALEEIARLQKGQNETSGNKGLEELQTANENLKRENDDLISTNRRLSKAVEVQLTEITSLLTSKLGTMCSLAKLQSAVEEVPAEEIPDDSVYIGDGKYRRKDDIGKINREKGLAKRTQKLVDLFWPGEVHLWSLTGKDGKGEALNTITDKHISAIIKLLETMKWGYDDKDRSVNAVRRIISKYTSDVREIREREKKNKEANKTDASSGDSKDKKKTKSSKKSDQQAKKDKPKKEKRKEPSPKDSDDGEETDSLFEQKKKRARLSSDSGDEDFVNKSQKNRPQGDKQESELEESFLGGEESMCVLDAEDQERRDKHNKY